METSIEYPGKNPLATLKAKEVLPEQGIIFVLEPYTYNKEYKNTAVGNVLFYDKLEFLWEHLGGHMEVHPPGEAKKVIFIIQNSNDPDSKREPFKRLGGHGYASISFKSLDSTSLENDNQVLVQKTPSHPGYNYGLSNWERSFSRVFEKNDIEGLKFTIINALHEKIGITEADAKVAAEKIIDKFI